MKDFIAIVAATPEGRLAKYQGFDNLKGAETHVASVQKTYPKAFSIAKPAFPFSAWKINMNAKTIIDVPPPPPPPSAREVLADALDSAPDLASVKALLAVHFRT